MKMKKKRGMDTAKTMGTIIGIGVIALGAAAYFAMNFVNGSDRHKYKYRCREDEGMDDDLTYSYPVYDDNDEDDYAYNNSSHGVSGCCSCEEDDEEDTENIYTYPDSYEGGRYQETMAYRRNRSNRKVPKGILGTKWY